MADNQQLLALDVGQSGSRISINGELKSIQRAMHAGEPVENTVAAILENLRIDAPKVALSLTGLYGDVGDVSRFKEVCHKYSNTKEVLVIDDGLANLAGSLQGQSGVSLTLGGGVVAVGGNSGAFSHSDGLSSFFGDEGGGFWLGSRGLTRALATRDERDTEFELMTFFENEIKEYDALKSKNSPEANLLAIKSAEKLLIAADNQIPIAVKIRNEGAALLAKTVVSAWRKIGTKNSNFLVTISGGLSKNENYQRRIIEEINQLEPLARLIEPEGDNLAGAIWLFENIKEDVRPMLAWARN
jgi:N-acetylglucosamine kinase-like BadF-type ATPase